MKDSEGTLMKRTAIVGGFVAVIAVIGTAFGLLYFKRPKGIPAELWQEFRPEGCHYRVEMPGEPKLGSEMLRPHIATRSYACSVRRNDIFWNATYLELKSEKLSQQAFNQLYLDLQNEAVRTTSGAVVGEADITLGGVPGKEFHVRGSLGDLHITRVCLVASTSPHRIYVLKTMGFERPATHPDFTRFFESFRIEG